MPISQTTLPKFVDICPLPNTWPAAHNIEVFPPKWNRFFFRIYDVPVSCRDLKPLRPCYSVTVLYCDRADTNSNSHSNGSTLEYKYSLRKSWKWQVFICSTIQLHSSSSQSIWASPWNLLLFLSHSPLVRYRNLLQLSFSWSFCLVTVSQVPNCAHNYTVKLGDVCDSISAAQNVSTYVCALSRIAINHLHSLFLFW